ncbi:MAG: hypothetical protein IIA55_10025 [Gemmatimonadetes bacterium]|nr:hypothetical protein [Gemmatimonadota bacterium]
MEATGRHISAILALRFENLSLDQGEYGAIRWPAETAKCGRELAPLAEGRQKGHRQIGT